MKLAVYSQIIPRCQLPDVLCIQANKKTMLLHGFFVLQRFRWPLRSPEALLTVFITMSPNQSGVKKMCRQHG